MFYNVEIEFGVFLFCIGYTTSFRSHSIWFFTMSTLISESHSVYLFIFWMVDLWCSVPEIVFLPLLGVRVVGRDVGNDQKAAYFPFLEVVQCDLWTLTKTLINKVNWYEIQRCNMCFTMLRLNSESSFFVLDTLPHSEVTQYDFLQCRHWSLSHTLFTCLSFGWSIFGAAYQKSFSSPS